MMCRKGVSQNKAIKRLAITRWEKCNCSVFVFFEADEIIGRNDRLGEGAINRQWKASPVSAKALRLQRVISLIISQLNYTML